MNKPYMTSREAAAELNVSRATLYAYVSRGLVRSEPAEDGRSRLYRVEDVRALRTRKTPRGPDEVAEQALAFGAPVMESAITLIAEGRYYYRGRDASRLAEAASLETVAGLLWSCGGRDPFAAEPPANPDCPPGLTGVARGQAMLAAAGATDLRALNLQPWGVACTGAHVLRLLASAFAGASPSAEPVHLQLATAWGVGEAGAELIRAALVLCADHEFNVSTFTVRCVASAQATPYAAMVAGLAALQGPRHGGQAAQVAALLDEALACGDAQAAAANRLQRGEKLPGFGHPLYPDGDPRYETLRGMLERYRAGPAGGDNARPDTRTLTFIDDLARAARDLTDVGPNIDFGLATLQRALGLPDGAPMALFATGRCVGWIAHAQEQYARPGLIRPRARYTGEQPQPAHTAG